MGANSNYIKGSLPIVMLGLGFLLMIGGVGGIEANTEVTLPLDSLALALVGLGMFAMGGLMASAAEE